MEPDTAVAQPVYDAAQGVVCGRSSRWTRSVGGSTRPRQVPVERTELDAPHPNVRVQVPPDRRFSRRAPTACVDRFLPRTRAGHGLHPTRALLRVPGAQSWVHLHDRLQRLCRLLLGHHGAPAAHARAGLVLPLGGWDLDVPRQSVGDDACERSRRGGSCFERGEPSSRLVSARWREPATRSRRRVHGRRTRCDEREAPVRSASSRHADNVASERSPECYGAAGRRSLRAYRR